MLLLNLFTRSPEPGAVVKSCDEPEEETVLAKSPYEEEEPIK
jgi:hypothetical protein